MNTTAKYHKLQPQTSSWFPPNHRPREWNRVLDVIEPAYPRDNAFNTKSKSAVGD